MASTATGLTGPFNSLSEAEGADLDDAIKKAHVKLGDRQADALERIAASLEALAGVVETRTAVPMLRTADMNRPT